MGYGIMQLVTLNYLVLDSDWVGSLDDRKSTSGLIFNLGLGVVSWTSKKQDTILLSSCEAEYIVVSSTTFQAIWMRRILEDMCQKTRASTIIYCDNKSTISLTKNHVFYGHTKHVEIRHHFVRDATLK